MNYRKFKIYCTTNEDHSEFTLVAECNGEVITTQTEHSFEDVMIKCYVFFQRIVTTYWPQSGVDTIEVNLSYKFV